MSEENGKLNVDDLENVAGGAGDPTGPLPPMKKDFTGKDIPASASCP